MPKVSPHTRKHIEGRCNGKDDTDKFVKDTWRVLINNNPKLSSYLFNLFRILGEPRWRGTATIAVCQLYMALEIEMTRVPEVSKLAFRLIQNRLIQTDKEKFWGRKVIEFRYGNPELSKLVDYSSLEWIGRNDQSSAEGVSQVALTIYLLIESQMLVSRTPFLEISGKAM